LTPSPTDYREKPAKGGAQGAASLTGT
jgi:hypothetical protein